MDTDALSEAFQGNIYSYPKLRGFVVSEGVFLWFVLLAEIGWNVGRLRYARYCNLACWQRLARSRDTWGTIWSVSARPGHSGAVVNKKGVRYMSHFRPIYSPAESWRLCKQLAGWRYLKRANFLTFARTFSVCQLKWSFDGFTIWAFNLFFFPYHCRRTVNVPGVTWK